MQPRLRRVEPVDFQPPRNQHTHRSRMCSKFSRGQRLVEAVESALRRGRPKSDPLSKLSRERSPVPPDRLPPAAAATPIRNCRNRRIPKPRKELSPQNIGPVESVESVESPSTQSLACPLGRIGQPGVECVEPLLSAKQSHLSHPNSNVPLTAAPAFTPAPPSAKRHPCRKCRIPLKPHRS